MERTDTAHLAFKVFESNDCESKDSPIFLLHGMTSCCLTWGAISQELANKSKRKVYAIDLRNHGDSEWKEEHNYNIMAKDVSCFMDEQNVKSAILIGHSMGGKVAMALAMTYPEKVDKFIVEDISPRVYGPSPKRFPFEFLKLLRKSLDKIPATADLESAKIIAANYLYENTPVIHKSAADRAPNPAYYPLQKDENGFSWKTNIDVLEAEFFKKENPKNLIPEGRYEKDVLFIYGSISPYNVSEDKELILNYFPRAIFQPFEGATHLVHSEYPNEFLESVLKFLS